jgi:hypothetical protein
LERDEEKPEEGDESKQGMIFHTTKRERIGCQPVYGCCGGRG